MAVRRLQEEGGLICKEMKQHYTVLTHKLSKFERLINEISSKCKPLNIHLFVLVYVVLYFFLMYLFVFQLSFQRCVTLHAKVSCALFERNIMNLDI